MNVSLREIVAAVGPAAVVGVGAWLLLALLMSL